MNSPTTETKPTNVYQDRDQDRRRAVGMMGSVVDWAASTDCKVKTWRIYRGGFIQEEVSAKVSAGNYLRKRQTAVALCGRSAVGVSLFAGGVNSSPSERVHHGQCRDRLCPICNAIRGSALKASMTELIKSEYEIDSRLLFGTFTVPHALNDKLLDTRKLLDKTWARFIRRKLIKEIFSERHRVAEVEYTHQGGWHPHFHVLWKLNRKSEAEYWARNRLERLVKEQWVSCCFSAARSMGIVVPAAYQVTLHEMRQCPKSLLTDKEKADGHPRILRWIPPRDANRITARAIKNGFRVMHHAKSWWVVQPIGKAVDELTKYITKRHSIDATGKAKKGQVGFWDYTPEMLYEYMMGIRGWNLHRSSKGWAQLQKANDEALDAEKQIQEDLLGGADFFSWAQITIDSKHAVRQIADGVQNQDYISNYNRILTALVVEGCDLSAKALRPYLARVLGDCSKKRLPDLDATNWQMAAHQREQEANEVLQSDLANREYIRMLAIRSNPPNLFTQAKKTEGKYEGIT